VISGLGRSSVGKRTLTKATLASVIKSLPEVHLREASSIPFIADSTAVLAMHCLYSINLI